MRIIPVVVAEWSGVVNGKANPALLHISLREPNQVSHVLSQMFFFGGSYFVWGRLVCVVWGPHRFLAPLYIFNGWFEFGTTPAVRDP